MNGEHPSPAPGDPGAEADELASAYLDGELAPAERAHVEANPAAMDRVAELGAVRDLVAAPVAALDEDRREAMLRAALEAFDADARGEEPVVSLDGRRRARRVLRVLGPVAAAAAAVAAVAFVARDDDDEGTAADDPAAVSVAAEAGTEELATVAAEGTAAPAETVLQAPAADVAEESAATEAPAGAGQAEDGATGGAATETTAAASNAELGEQVPALAAALDSLPDLGAASTPAEVADLLSGASPRTTGPDNTPAVHAALADCAGLAGVPVAGVSYQGERALLVPLDGSTYAVIALDCRIVAEVAVTP